MRFDATLVDLTKIPDKIGGQGGFEHLFSEFFAKWKRVDAPLYDFCIETPNGTIKVELKKQDNLQWFDSGKYHDLSPEDRSIVMMFILHKKGTVNKIIATTLGEFIDWLTKNNPDDGWNAEVIETGNKLRKKYPSLQFKAPAYIRKIYKKAPELFDTIF
jgi:hypothetical protein